MCRNLKPGPRLCRKLVISQKETVVGSKAPAPAASLEDRLSRAALARSRKSSPSESGRRGRACPAPFLGKKRNCRTDFNSFREKKVLQSRLAMGAVQGRECGCDPWNFENDLNACQPDIKKKKSKYNADGRVGSDFPEPSGAKKYFVEEMDSLNPNVSETRSARQQSTRSSCLRDKRILLSALTKTNMNQSPKSSVQDEVWTVKQDHQLEMAVKAISFSKQVRLPLGEDLFQSFKDGRFQSESSRDFWQCVSLKMRFGDAATCFQRYCELHGSGVARFVAPSRSSWGSNPYHSLDDAGHQNRNSSRL